MTRTLRSGIRGPDVARWQQFLSSLGFEPGSVDGNFGEGTDKATRAFQTKNGLEVDGIVGPDTLKKAGELGLRTLRRLRNDEVTPALTAEARRMLAAHRHDPYGSEFPFEIDGVHYVARIEEHYHPPGGPMKPWGYHPGVSLFLDASMDNHVEAPDETVDPPVPLSVDPAPPIATRGTIVIDPGHGGTETIGSSSPNNAKSPSGVLEKTLTLTMAELVRAEIARLAVDARVELTRTSDVNLGLADRARVARDAKADLFLSLHFNGFNGASRGVEAWIRPKDGGNVNHAEDLAFAESVLDAAFAVIAAADPGTKNRGVKEGNMGVLRDDELGNTLAQHPCRACLLELEFIDVQKVDELFNAGQDAPQFRTKVAQAIAVALLRNLS
jgi:N-acetylmuramoyl-L-alanine amidase